jgi:hypothetical protein
VCVCVCVCERCVSEVGGLAVDLHRGTERCPARPWRSLSRRQPHPAGTAARGTFLATAIVFCSAHQPPTRCERQRERERERQRDSERSSRPHTVRHTAVALSVSPPITPPRPGFHLECFSLNGGECRFAALWALRQATPGTAHHTAHSASSLALTPSRRLTRGRGLRKRSAHARFFSFFLLLERQKPDKK